MTRILVSSWKSNALLVTNALLVADPMFWVCSGLIIHLFGIKRFSCSSYEFVLSLVFPNTSELVVGSCLIMLVTSLCPVCLFSVWSFRALCLLFSCFPLKSWSLCLSLPVPLIISLCFILLCQSCLHVCSLYHIFTSCSVSYVLFYLDSHSFMFRLASPVS